MIETITSANNSAVKQAIALHQKKYRDQTGQFIAEGIRLIEEVIDSGWETECLFLTEKGLKGGRAAALVDCLLSRHCRIIKVPDVIFDKIASTENSQGVLAVVKKQIIDFSNVLNSKKDPLIVILDSIQDPGNLGSIIRTVDAADWTVVLLTEGCVDVYSEKVVRASMGSLFHVPVIEKCKRDEIFDILREKGIDVLATSLEHSQSYLQTDFSKPLAVIFGNEGNGVSQEMIARADASIHIPLVGKAESLNVAAAAAIILYEAVRQRQ